MSGLKNRLTERARELGFAMVRVIEPERQERYERIALSRGVDLSRRCTDPRDVMADCRSVVQLVYPYAPFALEPAGALPSAYYVASNACNAKARELAAWLEEKGYAATSAAGLPEKALAERAGAGRYGRNGIIACGEYGSRIVLASIVTSAELERDGAREMGEGLSPECEGCDACVRACPVGALDGGSAVDRSLCLRAQPDGQPFPEAWRPLLGGSYIGCDLCQDCCPRNAKVGRVPAPGAVAEAFDLMKLLSGDLDGVGGLIGGNYARKERLQARACYLAANLGRRDCLVLMEALRASDSELARDAAEWAIERLSR